MIYWRWRLRAHSILLWRVIQDGWCWRSLVEDSARYGEVLCRIEVGRAGGPAGGGSDDRYLELSVGALPTIVKRENKFAAGAIVFVSTAILYLTSNHFHIFRPRLLSMGAIDTIIPFLPSTVWIYISQYIYLVVVYWSYRDVKNLNKFVYAFLSLQVFSALIFWLWPTAIPRELFPLSQNLDPATSVVLTALRRADTTANCFPSVHVSSVFLTCLLHLNENRRKFLFFFIWAAVIAVSTLTVKQHYFIDVAAGILLALIFHFIFQRVRFSRDIDSDLNRAVV